MKYLNVRAKTIKLSEENISVKLLPDSDLQTLKICSRNTIVQSWVCGLPPKVSPRMPKLYTSHMSFMLFFTVKFTAHGKYRVGLAVWEQACYR